MKRLPPCVLAFLAVSAFAADTPKSATQEQKQELARALELYDQFKMAEAYPLLQKLANENPDDPMIWERCGVAMVNWSQTLTDPEQRKLARVKAREILLKAQSMGDNSNLLTTILSMMPTDGSEPAFSGSKEVDAIMQQAEADFAKGDMQKAIEGYQAALRLDPKLYTAPLFIGDSYFKKNENGKAGEWYARAIAINPNIETAYRYWGDSLMAEGRMKEARAKFIEAVVANPYVNRSWTGLEQWADRNNVTLAPLSLHEFASVSPGKDGKMEIHLSKSETNDDERASAAWLGYAAVRASWQADKFKKEFPAAGEYRRTLAEETAALDGMVKVLGELQAKEKPPKKPLPADLAELMRIDKAGMLQPFILLQRADKDIAQDYDTYRQQHRDLLVRYLDEFVVPQVN